VGGGGGGGRWRGRVSGVGRGRERGEVQGAVELGVCCHVGCMGILGYEGSGDPRQVIWEVLRYWTPRGNEFVKHVHVLSKVPKGLLEANPIAFGENILDHDEAIQGYLSST